MIECIKIIKKEIKVIVILLNQKQKELSFVKRSMRIDHIFRWIVRRVKGSSVLHVVSISLES